MREALVKSGRPKLSVIDFDNSGITQRLTDFTNYPHRHRTRFDSNGQSLKDCNWPSCFIVKLSSSGNGLGAAGRRDVRDLPVLWATPSSDGFMMTCPSVLGAGREGATSPINPRRFGYE